MKKCIIHHARLHVSETKVFLSSNSQEFGKREVVEILQNSWDSVFQQNSKLPRLATISVTLAKDSNIQIMKFPSIFRAIRRSWLLVILMITALTVSACNPANFKTEAAQVPQLVTAAFR